jgi:AraC-like DNA-binding protein/mannose-6-phosphate isomerase-like protein (cupin superfamily)
MTVDLRVSGCSHEHIRHQANSQIRPFLHGPRAIPFHWHPEMEILLVLRGSARLIVDGCDCLMQEDDLMIINADAAHNSDSLSEDTLICGVHIDAGHFERLGLAGFAGRQYLCRTFLHGRSFRRRVDPIAAFMARLMLSGGAADDQGLVAPILGMMLCGYIHRRIEGRPSRGRDAGAPVGRERVARVIGRIRETAGRAPLGRHAEEEGVSLSHLSRLFKLHTGLGFRDYEQSMLLDRFAAALSGTKLPIVVILQELGIGNASLFFHRFRTQFGCTPATFRRGQVNPLVGRGLSVSGEAEAIARLRRIAEGLGAATEQALGLPKITARITSSAPHNASY